MSRDTPREYRRFLIEDEHNCMRGICLNEYRWSAWLQQETLDLALRQELEQMIEDGRETELQECFMQDLQFGTGGMREKMGPGTNRMNVYTVRKASYGVAQWIVHHRPKHMWKLAIGYDGRRDSKRFAQEVARVVAAFGVHSYVFTEARPTPLLSFAVRELGCGGGVMVTASHNPPAYNGYKVYGSDGGQVLEADALQIISEMEGCGDLFSIPRLSTEDMQVANLVHDIGVQIETAYYQQISSLFHAEPDAEKRKVTIVYTPLHGTGAQPVVSALHQAGYQQVVCVESQMPLDAAFTHVQSPNPEDASAYVEAIALAKSVSADIILATDPDADRVGLMVRTASGEYTLLTGNEVGGLLLYDLLKNRSNGELRAGSTAITTIVSSGFGEVVAKSFGVLTERVLTGFKYIGDKIGQYEKSGERAFVFGYEESVGYLVLPFVRDKDAVQTAVAIANMVVSCKRESGGVSEQLEQLYEQFGYFTDDLSGYLFTGLQGTERMKALMETFREDGLQVAGFHLESIEDYRSLICTRVQDGSTTQLHLPSSDVLIFRFAKGQWIAIRPSGTEPKLKVYIGVTASTKHEAEEKRVALVQAVQQRITPFLR